MSIAVYSSTDPKIIRNKDLLIVPVIKSNGQAVPVQGIEQLAESTRELIAQGIRNHGDTVDARYRNKFTGKADELLTVYRPLKIGFDNQPVKTILVGLGEPNNVELSTVRKVVTKALKNEMDDRTKNISLLFPNGTNLEQTEIAQAISETAIYETFVFDEYKSDRGDRKATTLDIYNPDPAMQRSVERGVALGRTTSEAQELARYIASKPASDMTPKDIADIALKISGENRLKIEILTKRQCEKLGMGSFLAVSKGSDQAPRFIVLKYTPEGPARKHIAIVGKGVTFDSGGLSLKPSDSMLDMKCDKSGAGAVLGVMSVIEKLRNLSALQPDVQITMIAPCTENMTGGSAYKLGDVVRAMNGKTIEIHNTDAEGRLILADGIAYAVREGAHEIVDLATLTGACVVALGDDKAGVMSNDQGLANRIVTAGTEVGETMWQLPVSDRDRDAIKSDVADMKNVGTKGQAGAQSGYVLLERFAGDKPLGHIDIAGPAWPKGDKWPTGFGARTVINLLTKHT